MKFEDQIVSLKFAKQLMKLGVKQESLFWWHECQRPEDGHIWSYACDYYRIDTDRAFEDVFAAYTVAELGEVLPRYVERYDTDVVQSTPIGTWELVTFPEHNGLHRGFHVRYLYKMRAITKCEQIATAPQPYDIAFTEKTEANARAKMLIYLIENNLITI